MNVQSRRVACIGARAGRRHVPQTPIWHSHWVSAMTANASTLNSNSLVGIRKTDFQN